MMVLLEFLQGLNKYFYEIFSLRYILSLEQDVN